MGKAGKEFAAMIEGWESWWGNQDGCHTAFAMKELLNEGMARWPFVIPMAMDRVFAEKPVPDS